MIAFLLGLSVTLFLLCIYFMIMYRNQIESNENLSDYCGLLNEVIEAYTDMDNNSNRIIKLQDEIISLKDEIIVLLEDWM